LIINQSSLEMKQLDQLESFLALNEIKHTSQYIEIYESSKSSISFKIWAFEEAIDHWNSGETIEY